MFPWNSSKCENVNRPRRPSSEFVRTPTAVAHSAGGVDLLVVKNADSAVKPELPCTHRNLVRVSGFSISLPSTELIVTEKSACSASHSSFRSSTLGFLRNIVRIDVIDADLQIIEAGGVEPLDAVRSQQITVCDQRGNSAVFPNPPYELI